MQSTIIAYLCKRNQKNDLLIYQFDDFTHLNQQRRQSIPKRPSTHRGCLRGAPRRARHGAGVRPRRPRDARAAAVEADLVGAGARAQRDGEPPVCVARCRLQLKPRHHHRTVFAPVNVDWLHVPP